jgi:hypothetical protein
VSTIPTAPRKDPVLEFVATMPALPGAACVGDPELFFVDEYRGYPAAVRAAKDICAECPALKACRDWVLDHPQLAPFGVWAGLTAAERRAGHTRPCDICTRPYTPRNGALHCGHPDCRAEARRRVKRRSRT